MTFKIPVIFQINLWFLISLASGTLNVLVIMWGAILKEWDIQILLELEILMTLNIQACFSEAADINKLRNHD